RAFSRIGSGAARVADDFQKMPLMPTPYPERPMAYGLTAHAKLLLFAPVKGASSRTRTCCGRAKPRMRRVAPAVCMRPSSIKKKRTPESPLHTVTLELPEDVLGLQSSARVARLTKGPTTGA